MRLGGSLALLVLSVALSGCVYSSSQEQGPNGQSTQFSSPTHYSRTEQWGAPDVVAVTEPWQNPFPGAQMDFTGQVGPGRLTVGVTDGSGDTVYEKAINGPWQGTFSERVGDGAPGMWHVTFERMSAGGQFTMSLTSAR